MPVPVTVPLPVPPLETVRVRWAGGTAVKDGESGLAGFSVSVQVVAVPVQAPLQPAKVEPAVGLAVRVTLVPSVYVSEQSAPHEMPVPVTVPLPVPAFETVSVRWAGGTPT